MGEVRFTFDKAPVDVLEGSVGFRLVRTTHQETSSLYYKRSPIPSRFHVTSL